ncbi:hypothetical protein N2152v2_009406 [Parachlorella kessleri]
MIAAVERFVSTGPPAAGQVQPGSGDGHAQALEAVLKTLHEAYSPAIFNGAQLMSQLAQSRLLPTGCPSIDSELLRGGFREGQLAEVCGESASGKTQLCLSCAAHTALRGEGVVFVDTSNAFSAGRLQTLLQAVSQAQVAVEDALNFVTVHQAYDIHAVLGVVDSLFTVQAQPPAAAAPKLVIIDSLSAVIGPVLGGGGGQHSQGHALLAAAGTSLKALAARLGAVVIITNHMVGGGEGGRGEKRPAMGESWKNQPHIRLQLSAAEGAGSAAGPQQGSSGGRAGAAQQHLATLRASTYCAAGGQAPFWLAPAGLVAAPHSGEQVTTLVH